MATKIAQMMVFLGSRCNYFIFYSLFILGSYMFFRPEQCLPLFGHMTGHLLHNVIL